jgi:hypothetical protein
VYGILQAALSNVYDSLYSLPAALPFPAGTSPFRQKGNAYLGDIAYINQVVPGGFGAVLAAITDPNVRQFLGQPFRGGEWYDVLPNPYMQATAARLRNVSFEEHLRGTGVYHANEAVTGFYKALLRLVSNENIAIWMPRISGLYHEFGRCETRVVGPKNVHGVRTGIPRMLVRWLAVVSSSFCEKALRLAGATNARVVFGAVEPDGSTSGHPLHRVHLDITWE